VAVAAAEATGVTLADVLQLVAAGQWTGLSTRSIRILRHTAAGQAP